MSQDQQAAASTIQILVTGWLRAGEEQALATYQGVAGPLLGKHGAAIDLKVAPSQSFAGEKPDIVLLVNFPSLEAANQVFGDPEYLAIVPTRDRAFERINIVALA